MKSLDKEDTMSNTHFLLSNRIAPRLLLLAAVLGLLVTTIQPAQAQTLTTLYSFAGGAAGGLPNGGLAIDGQGNLYGTTFYGGWISKRRPVAYGTVFKLAPTGAETVLHSFTRYPDGGSPYAGLIIDAQGNLYGTTSQGGTGTCNGPRRGCGTVLELAPSGAETVLYNFQGWPDAQNPSYGGLIMDAQRNLYGATVNGGYYKRTCHYGGRHGPHTCGTVFEVTPTGSEKVLYMFAGPPDGLSPWGGVIRDAQGNLYGTTELGGAYGGAYGYAYGCGTVFKLTPTGVETVLHSFCSSSADGAFPRGDLVLDAQGNLYGTTGRGGSQGRGTVFQLTPDGTETVLYNFTGGADGDGPSGLIMDLQGNLYGTTPNGGAYSYGTVFELTPAGIETVLYSFCSKSGCPDGANPSSGLVMDSEGNLYGTTASGGIVGGNCGSSGCGTVFKLTP